MRVVRGDGEKTTGRRCRLLSYGSLLLTPDGRIDVTSVAAWSRPLLTGVPLATILATVEEIDWHNLFSVYEVAVS